MITISNDDQILDLNFRQEALQYFKKDNETRMRVEESWRRSRVYSDQTKAEVIKLLEKELKPASVAQMINRASNISICRKIIDKLAASYVGGVQRVAQDESDQQAVDELARLINLDSKMKLLDRKFELQKNAIFGVLPYKALDSDFRDGEQALYTLKAFCYEPYRYHALADTDDNEVARCLILQEKGSSEPGQIQGIPSTSTGRSGGAKDLSYSGAVYGQDDGEYIWWSSKYHFTTDGEGNILKAPEAALNPIGRIPYVTFAENQNGNFWGCGGEDLIDGSILVNLLMTDMINIANAQGWGQLVLTGKNLPKDIQVGPYTAVVLDQQEGDPTPTFDYKTTGAPLEKWMQMVEQYVALLLSTNHLSPATVSAKLDASNPQSGIALLVEQAESTLDLEDRQKVYQDKEREIWEIIRRWQDVYQGALAPEFAEIPQLKSSDVRLKFMRTKPVITEDQKLQNIKLRKDLGINTEVDLLKLDNPDMTDEEAQEKLKQIMAEKLAKMATVMTNAMEPMSEDESEPESDEEADDDAEETEQLQ